ncbi:MAG: hypothetical protein OXU61_11905 [Gammaproteobacteria bacterium]|nr:hypothetical protein [Gammaproteobacteria bacterium]
MFRESVHLTHNPCAGGAEGGWGRAFGTEAPPGNGKESCGIVDLSLPVAVLLRHREENLPAQ